jgi:hypothetical protein
MKLGTLVRDDFGRLGIVCTRKERPGDDWIKEHLHAAEIRKFGDDVAWWGVMPQEPHCRRRRGQAERGAATAG